MEVACPDLLDSIMGRSEDEDSGDDLDIDRAKPKYAWAYVGKASWYSDGNDDGDEHKPKLKSMRKVQAPAGQLGITLRGEGPTSISAVQSGSVLMGKVRAGDAIVSIDGVNVTKMSSTQIKQILASKNEYQRLIVTEPAKQQHVGVDYAEPVQKQIEPQVKFQDIDFLDDNSTDALRKAVGELRAQLSALEKKAEELESRSFSEKSGCTDSTNGSFNGGEA
jgi:BMFP domain-containing protein YqiC